MRGYIIGLVIVIIVGFAGLALWKLVFKSTPPEPVETVEEQSGFEAIQDIIDDYTPMTQTDFPTALEVIPSEMVITQELHSALAPVTPYGQFEYYVVQKGDTLWDISKKFYRTGTKYKSIYEANRDKLSSLNMHLKPGMKLSIPGQGIQKQPTAREYPLEHITPQGGTYYTVKKGDSLEKISLKFYKSRSKYRIIFQANRDKLTTPETILRIGWKLFIPSLGRPVRSPMPPVEENIPTGVPE